MENAGVHMYFVAIVLPKELNEKILLDKNFMLEKFDCKVGLKSPAHITIIPPFWMDAEKETGLIHDVESLSKNLSAFTIKTNDYSAFRPRTIFVDVHNSEELQNIKKVSDDFFRQLSQYKIKIDKRAFHPHITIATRDLLRKSFHEAWPLFENKKFEEEWLATALSVLRHNKKNWDVIYTSFFISH